jgi:hypothetical protein
MSQARKKLPEDTVGQGGCSEERLRSVITACADIPAQVREARFTRIDERVIDESLLKFLTEHFMSGREDDVQAARIKRRAEALSPYLGKTLACVLIMLPGVRYTIEVDCCAGRVVHWEWQPG